MGSQRSSGHHPRLSQSRGDGMKARLLDLFSGAGGAAMGYSRAGFEVVGVDIERQKNYPFEFIRLDALKILEEFWTLGFDAIHASPPCQAYSITRHTHGVEHPDLLEETRRLLRMTQLPYVIENVVGADMPGSVILCGSDLCKWVADTDLTLLFLKRHRQ